MKINYSLNHELLNLSVFTEEKLTTTTRIVTWIVLSQIAHFTKVAGSCSLNKNQICIDLQCHHKFLKTATDLLLKYKLIREISPARKAQRIPAVYATTKDYGTECRLHRHRVTLPMAQGAQYNNNNYYKTKNDVLVHHPSESNPHPPGSIPWIEWEEKKQKQ